MQTPQIILQKSSSPVVTKDGEIMLANTKGELKAISANSGDLLWSAPITVANADNPVDRMVDIASTPIINNQTIYIMAYQGKVKALDLNSRQQIWSRDISGYQDITQDAHHIFLTTTDSQVIALDKTSGQTIWVQKKLANRTNSAPTVLNSKYLLVGDYAGYVHILSIQDGSLLGREKLFKNMINTKAQSLGPVTIVNSINGQIKAIAIKKAIYNKNK